MLQIHTQGEKCCILTSLSYTEGSNFTLITLHTWTGRKLLVTSLVTVILMYSRTQMPRLNSNITLFGPQMAKIHLEFKKWYIKITYSK